MVMYLSHLPFNPYLCAYVDLSLFIYFFHFFQSECLDGALFNHLLCIWKINKGPKNIQNTCSLNFYVSIIYYKSL